MKKFTFLLVFAFLSVLGINAQVTLPFYQDFSSLTGGDMADDASSSATAVSVMPTNIASVSSAFQAGGAMRIGGGSNIGGFVTQNIIHGGLPKIKVKFNAVPCPGTTLQPTKVTISYGSQSQIVVLAAPTHSWAITPADFLPYSVEFSSIAAATPLVFTTVAEAGHSGSTFIDDLKVIDMQVGSSLTEGFEGAVFPPYGWKTLHVVGEHDWEAVNDSIYALSGNKYAMVAYGQQEENINWLIFPKVVPSAGQKFIYYWIKANYPDFNTGTTAKFRVSTTASDTSNFTTIIKSYQTGPDSKLKIVWQKDSLDLSSYINQPIHIAVQVRDSNNGSSIMLDSIYGSPLFMPDCPNPTTLAVSSITDASAYISWSSSFELANNFILEYSTTPTFTSNVITENILDSYSVTLSNLQGNTVYYVRIKSDCRGGEYSEWEQISFRTTCGAITALPLTENFSSIINNTTNLTYCWTKVSGSRSAPAVTSADGNNDSKSIKMAVADSLSSENIVATPLFADSLKGLQVSFWLKRASITTESKFDVGVMSDVTDRNTFVLIKETALPTNNIWTPYVVHLANAPSTHRYIAFRMKATGDAAATYYLDDVNVDSVDHCSAPTDLSAFNIKKDSITITFTPTGTETAWQYIITDNMNLTDLSTLIPIDITNDTIVIAGLTPSTQYKVWIRAKCSPTDLGNWIMIPLVVQTTCNKINIGWSDSFNNTDINKVPVCWNIGKSYTYQMITYPSQVKNSRPDSVGLGFIVNYTWNRDTIMISTPEVEVPLNTTQLSFYAQRPNRFNFSDGNLEIGAVSDVNNINTFIVAKTVTASEIDSVWRLHKVLFTNIPSTHKYIAFRVTSGTEAGVFVIDDVSLHAAPTCIEPSNLRVNSATQVSAEISFVPAAATQTAWQYILTDNAALTDLSTLTPIDITNDTFTISGLALMTQYRVWVRAKCSPTDLSDWSNPLSINTECSAVSIPISEDFESYQTTPPFYIPNCWAKITTNNQYPSVELPSVSDGLPTKTIKFADSKPQYLIMTKLDIPLSEVQLKFKLNREDFYSGKFQVGYMANQMDASTFVPVATFDDGDYKELLTKIVYFHNVPDNNGINRYIAFRYGDVETTNANTEYFYWIDDIEITAAPTCMSPSNVLAENITDTSATITFTPEGTASSWILEYKKLVDTTWTQASIITATTYELTGLSPSIAYQVRVKSICSQTDQSLFSTPIRFNTLCGIATLPFKEIFALELNSCWGFYEGVASSVFNGGLMTPANLGWLYDADDSNGMAAPKMRSNIFGSDKRHWLVTPTIALTGANKKLEFDIAYTAYGTANPAEQTGTDDKFIVAIGVVDVNGAIVWSATNATVWNNDGTGDYVLNNIPNTPQHITIDLSTYLDKIIIGFYIESTVENADNSLHLDNISVVSTPIVRPTVTTLAATDIAQTTATLNKNVVAGNQTITEEGFYYKKVSSTDWTNTTTSSITGLTPATGYEFYAYAMVGTTIYPGNTMTFTTTTNVGLDITKQNIKLYPNPAKDVIRLMVEGLGTKANVSVIDMQGKVVGRYGIAKGGNSINIDVSSFAEGSYIVKVTSDNLTITERLIIKK